MTTREEIRKSLIEVSCFARSEGRVLPDRELDKETDRILALITSQWINVDDRLPEIGQMVTLVNIKKYANNGELKVDNEHVVQSGYLNEFGHKYWSVYGERALCLDAFTHWVQILSPPKNEKTK